MARHNYIQQIRRIEKELWATWPNYIQLEKTFKDISPRSSQKPKLELILKSSCLDLLAEIYIGLVIHYNCYKQMMENLPCKSIDEFKSQIMKWYAENDEFVDAGCTFLASAFVWVETPQGVTFWRMMNRQLKETLNHLTMQDIITLASLCKHEFRKSV